MGEYNHPSRSRLPLDLRPGGTMSARSFVSDLLLAEHVQHWGHWTHFGQKHNDLQEKHFSQSSFLSLVLIEDLRLSFVTALRYLLQKVQD